MTDNNIVRFRTLVAKQDRFNFISVVRANMVNRLKKYESTMLIQKVISKLRVPFHRVISKSFAILSLFMGKNQKCYMVIDGTVKKVSFAKGFAIVSFAILHASQCCA